MPEKTERRERGSDNTNRKLAYVLGALYGDGCFAHKDQNGRIHFGSSDLEFAENLAKLINDIFNIEIKLRVDKLSMKNRNWKDFHSFSSRKLYKYIGHYDWKLNKKLPTFIKEGETKTKSAFICGFFDAEGCVDLTSFIRRDGRKQITRQIKCFSNDTLLLNEVKMLLSELKIQSNIFRGKKPNYYLCVWNYRSLKLYQCLIGFNLRRKSELLKKAIMTYKQIQTRWDLETYKKVMKLRKQGLSATKIKKELTSDSIKVPLPTIEFWVYRDGKPLEEVQ